jgi:peroxiredoxin 2/4
LKGGKYMSQEDMPRTCLPQIGVKAPDFSGNSTFGPIRLSDYKGKWLVFFSHPGDFTPVWTTEFIAFAQCYPQFQSINTYLLGLSVDSNSSHLAWVYNIYKNTGIEIPFPILSDGNREIAQLYGMVSPSESETSTVRTVFIIDPKQNLRAILYYPLELGRNIPEILRMVQGFQTADYNKMAIPANWIPGKPVVIPPPKTYEELLERVDRPGCMDWYLCYTCPKLRRN